MAKSGKDVGRERPSLLPARAIELLKKQILAIEPLSDLEYRDPQVSRWENFTQQLLVKAFGDPHDNLDAFSEAGKTILYSDEEAIQENFIKALQEKKALLEGFVEQLDAFHASSSPTTSADRSVASKRIFVVHGHEARPAIELARILERLGFQPIILHEQANKGRTLIEKLEAHAQVGYCFVVMTPDDEGRLRGTQDSLQPRARQNVVFEFGLFVGALARERVCCLLSGNVDMPTDLGGLAQLRFNDSVDEKRFEIVQELKAAGFDVDADRLS